MIIARQLNTCKLFHFSWPVTLTSNKKPFENGVIDLSYNGIGRNFSCEFLDIEQVSSLGPHRFVTS